VGPAKSAVTRVEMDSLSEFTAEFLHVMEKAGDTYPTCVTSWLKYHKTAEVVAKMPFEFQLKLNTTLKSEIVLPNKEFEEWTPEELVDWLNTLKLSKNYSTTFLNQRIDGSGLTLIRERDLWKKYNISIQLDIDKIIYGMAKLLKV